MGIAVVAEPGPAAVFRPARIEPPRVRNATQLMSTVQRYAAQHSGAMTARRNPVVQVFASTDGKALRPELLVSSGDPAVDAEALRIGARIRFRPARMEGVPFEARTAFPMAFLPPGR